MEFSAYDYFLVWDHLSSKKICPLLDSKPKFVRVFNMDVVTQEKILSRL